MTTAFTRLHVSPLTPDLLPAVLGPTLTKIATNVSYHSLQSFPESSYGYIDLPSMEAEKTKKKLNGAILKGKKIKIEEARPSKRKHATRAQDEEADDVAEAVTKKSRKSKNSKTSGKAQGLLEGHELSPDRKVKRGWTEPKADKVKRKKDRSSTETKTQAPSKYTEKEELLFRTKVPKNKGAASKDTGKRKKGEKTTDVDVVHEFEKSTKIPSFLRTEAPGGQNATDYRDGEGWIDGQGQVVEAESKKVSDKRSAAKVGDHNEVLRLQSRSGRKYGGKTLASTRKASRQDTSSSPSSDSSDEEEERLDRLARGHDTEIHEDTESTSSSGTSDSESETESDASSIGVSDGMQEGSRQSDESVPAQSSLHPLEALFKRPSRPASLQVQSSAHEVAKPSLEVSTAFSFFGQQSDVTEPTDMPMTPFSTQDWRSRELRSAAPTPDTAHPSRMSSIFNDQESNEELSEMEDKDPDEPATSQQQRSSEEPGPHMPQTNFEKQFWEKRGENNRAWKARRRAVLKDQRQRENRARRPKNW